MTNENHLFQTLSEMEELEKKECNLALLFAEMFKDEINANDERKLYNGIKRVVKKYAEDRSAMRAINEFTSVIAGGASLQEIMQIAMDEAAHPTVTSQITIDDDCPRQ